MSESPYTDECTGETAPTGECVWPFCGELDGCKPECNEHYDTGLEAGKDYVILISKVSDQSGWTSQSVLKANQNGYDEGYDVGVQDSMLRATQYERILTDLIAELRRYPVGDVLDMSDRAEARLREVQG